MWAQTYTVHGFRTAIHYPSHCVAQEIINDGVNGMLRSDMDGWRDAMDLLSGDEKQRARMGQAARQFVEESFSLKMWGPKVREIIESL